MSKGKNRRPSSGGQRRMSAAELREQKRAQFRGAKKRSQLPIILGAVCVAVAVIVGVFVLTQKGANTSFAQAPTNGTSVTIPLSQVSDGNMHRYTYETGTTKINYFVMMSKDGTVRAAFDACDVCFQFKKGYHQQGPDAVQCNNCGRIFPADKINVVEGGCNPAPLKRTEKGGNLVIATTDIEAGANYFQ